MEIECLRTLTEQQKTEILALHAACMAPEGLQCEVFLSSELNFDRAVPSFFLLREAGTLVAFLTLFLPTGQEAEVTAFTLPAARRRGLFTALTEEAKRICALHGIPALLFAVEGNAKAGHAALSTLAGVQYQHTEYRMRLSGVPEKSACDEVRAAIVTARNMTQYREMLARAFDEQENEESAVRSLLTNPKRRGYVALLNGAPIGACHVSTEDGMAFLYALALVPGMRGHGYGEAFMREVTRIAVETGLPVVLDVDSKNVAALSLYRKLGFVETFSVEYYSQSLLPDAEDFG